MFNWIKKKIRHSKLNFYLQNFLFNVSFWLRCRKLYKTIGYRKRTGNFDIDEVGRMHYKYTTVKKKRFVGYVYKNDIYLDNPGMQIKDREQWESWRKKNLIK